ncbi:RAQPRD family integrative conjugative element protein [Pollutimonas sp. H1-120]|uniref:integrative conjugative element protein, RAQPRD family n=1 Tax=Pollutimonas sp. H1-120 TaxID=3148824 RepID=UPI003B52976A
MVLSIRCRAMHGGVCLLLTAILAVPPTVHADVPAQRQDLAAALRQLDTLERFVAQSAAAAPIVPGDRYHFDYPRLLADLALVRTGIQSHLTPSRAQPRDLAELAGDYRSERAPQHNPLPQAQP